MKKKIESVDIIKGLLKEALFLDLEVQLEISNKTSTARIVELNESGQEGILLYLNESIPVEDSDKVTVSIFFKNFMVKYTSPSLFLRSPFLMVEFPKQINLSNERAESRVILHEDKRSWMRVFLSNNESKIVAMFRPANISANGLGGELNFQTTYELRPGTKIEGDYWCHDQWLKISGHIRAVRQLTTLHDQTSYAVIGIENETSLVHQDQVKKESKSRAIRGQGSLELEFNLLLQTSKVFRIKLINFSISGFLAYIEDASLQNLILASKVIGRMQSSLRANLVSYNDHEFRFQWVEGAEKDRLQWLKEISPFLGPNIDAQTLSQDQILSLFCQSGALSEKYVREQKLLAKDTLARFEQGGISEPWIFNWTNRNEQGGAKAYFSALKSGDNSWSLTDLVSDRYNEKMDSLFVPSFFVAMKDFSLKNSPVPKSFIAWSQGHKFYQEFEKYLSDEGRPYLLGRCDMLYTRLQREKMDTTGAVFLKSKVEAIDYEKINVIRKDLEKNGLIEFADIMDFTINTFGSRGLYELLKSHHLPFKREYWQFTLSDNKTKYFCIFTYIPEGQNPGRFLDSIYVFDTNQHEVSHEVWSSFKNELVSLAASHGFSTHAIRRMAKEGAKHFADEVVCLTSLVLHPQAWAFYNRFLK